MPAAKPITPGTRFARLTVLSDDGPGAVHVRCDCGKLRVTARGRLRFGVCKSCGCLSRDTAVQIHTKHGHSGSPEYKAWWSMIDRCHNQANGGYKSYGGRGLVVCPRWRESLTAFMADMGPRPPKTSIDRIDNDLGYEPGNCRWATKREQQQNMRSNVLITWRDETLCVREWERRLGFATTTVWSRLDNGWSVERALTEPVRHRLPIRTATGNRPLQDHLGTHR